MRADEGDGASAKPRRSCIRFRTLIALGVMAAAVAAFAFPEHVALSKSDGRVWQTVFRPSEPIEWRWTDGAAKATVTLTNLVTGSVTASAPIAKGASAYGSFALPEIAAAADTGDRLVDLVVEEFDSSDVSVKTSWARLAIPKGVGGGAIDVEKPGPKFTRMKSPRVVSYDAAWGGTGAATAAERTFLNVTEPLFGTGGYFAQPCKEGTLSVAFTGSTLLLEAGLFPPRGLVLIMH